MGVVLSLWCILRDNGLLNMLNHSLSGEKDKELLMFKVTSYSVFNFMRSCIGYYVMVLIDVDYFVRLWVEPLRSTNVNI